MTDNLNLKLLSEKYNDEQYTMPTKFFGLQNKFRQYAFLILTPDAIQRGLVQNIMEFLHSNVEFEIKLLNTCNITKRQLELLYKYAFKRMILKDEPVYWWLLQESWAVGPCAVMLIYSPNCKGNSLVEKILDLKGSYQEYDEKTVRTVFDSISMIMNIIHSSDDAFNMIREASIFFNENDIYNAIDNPELFKIEDKVLNNQFVLTNYSSTVSEIIGAVKSRVYATFAMKEKSTIEKAIEIIDEMLLSNTFHEYTDEVARKYPQMYKLCLIAYALSEKNDIPISELEGLFDADIILISEWEKVVIKNYLLQRKWITN